MLEVPRCSDCFQRAGPDRHLLDVRNAPRQMLAIGPAVLNDPLFPEAYHGQENGGADLLYRRRLHSAVAFHSPSKMLIASRSQWRHPLLL
jgi:hypothetical protein